MIDIIKKVKESFILRTPILKVDNSPIEIFNDFCYHISSIKNTDVDKIEILPSVGNNASLIINPSTSFFDSISEDILPIKPFTIRLDLKITKHSDASVNGEVTGYHCNIMVKSFKTPTEYNGEWSPIKYTTDDYSYIRELRIFDRVRPIFNIKESDAFINNVMIAAKYTIIGFRDNNYSIVARSKIFSDFKEAITIEVIRDVMCDLIDLSTSYHISDHNGQYSCYFETDSINVISQSQTSRASSQYSMSVSHTFKEAKFKTNDQLFVIMGIIDVIQKRIRHEYQDTNVDVHMKDGSITIVVSANIPVIIPFKKEYCMT